MAQGMISIQVNGIDLGSKEKIDLFCKSITPLMAQEISSALNAPKTRGCSVSGTVTAGPGGMSGSGTISCTF